MFWLFLLPVFVIFVFFAFAYEPQPTHYSLAKKSAELFRQYYGNLSDEEISLIAEGAVKEDTPPRWINHFYDPTNGLGWTGARMGELPDYLVQRFSDIFLSSKNPVSALDWAHNQDLQTLYKNYEGNRTFEKAVYDYVNGNKKEAYETLGHILHLLEDMSVPAHTREDTHFDALGDPGEPYEKWTVQNTDLSALDSLNPKQENFSCLDLNDCFKKMAKYSNENFFSEDTINDTNYKKIIANRKTIIDFFEIYYRKDPNGQEYILLVKNLNTGEMSINQQIVHRSYWSRLSKEAVLAGVEAIRIFQDEAAKAGKDRSLLKSPPTSNSSSMISPYGEVVILWNGIKNVWDKVETVGSQAGSWISSQVANLFGSTSQVAINTREPQNQESSQTPSDNNLIGQSPGTEMQTSVQNKSTNTQITILPKNTIKTVEQKPPDSGQIEEQIAKPKAPPQITEKIFKPLPPNYQGKPEETSSNRGGGPDNEEVIDNATSSQEELSTSTPDALPQAFISFSDYSPTSRQFIVNWISSSTGALYDVENKQDEEEWQNWESNSSSTSKIFIVPKDNSTYYFRVRAKIANSTSTVGDWSQIKTPINFYPIAINEIAWAGTGTSSAARNDEWIELFNRTNFELDLSGWQIAEIDSATTTLITLKNKIAPKGYYLIERTDDNSIADIQADVFGSFGGSGLSNSGENLKLIDSKGNEIDWFYFSGGWPAGTASPDYRSMERVNPYLVWDIPGNWQSNATTTRNGNNIDGQLINGTPKTQNSVFNQDFFFLYPPGQTTATSTLLYWTRSSMINFKNYQILRALNSNFASSTIIATATTTEFFDRTLESEATYYYKILNCDINDFCNESNTVFIKTEEFPYLWSTPQIISEISTSTRFGEPAIGIAFDGEPLATWHGSISGMYQSPKMNYSKKQADGNWSVPQIISDETSMPIGYPDQLISKNGRLEILYAGIDESKINVANAYDIRFENGVWQKPISISENNTGYSWPSGAIDNFGTTHIVWQAESSSTPRSSAIFYRPLGANGTFLAPSQEIPGSVNGVQPNIIFDNQNRLHAFWIYHDAPYYNAIYHSSNNLDGNGWSEAKKIYDLGYGGIISYRLQIILDDEGNFMLAWAEQVAIIHFARFDGMASTSDDMIFKREQSSVSQPVIIISGSGKPYIFWSETLDNQSTLYFSYLKNSTGWQIPQKIYESNQRNVVPVAAAYQGDTLHLIWENNFSDIDYSFGKLE